MERSTKIIAEYRQSGGDGDNIVGMGWDGDSVGGDGVAMGTKYFTVSSSSLDCILVGCH